MAVRTQIFLAGDRDRLANSVTSVARELAAEVSWVRALVRLANDPTRSDSRATDSTGPSFEAVLDLETQAPASIAKALPGLTGADLARSAVLAGQVHQLLDPSPDARLALVLALRRQPHMTTAECQSYWRERHAPLALSIPGLAGYQQLHTDVDVSADLARRAGLGLADFDGAAEVSFASLDEFAQVMAQPDIAGAAFEDEREFLDHARSALALYEITHTASA